MAYLEAESIFLDLGKLRKELRKAGFLMEVRNRVDYLVPVQQEIADRIRVFVRCHREKDPRKKLSYIEALDTGFVLFKVDFQIADDEHIWRGPKDQFGNVKCVLIMLDLIGSIDEGISRWRNKLTKGRPASGDKARQE